MQESASDMPAFCRNQGTSMRFAARFVFAAKWTSADPDKTGIDRMVFKWYSFSLVERI
jgi:hypothetical protein